MVAPQQAVVMNITDSQSEYVQEVVEKLQKKVELESMRT